MEHNYHYDNLYRLDSASGAFVGANGKKANYSLAMGYDNMHNITRKRQDVVQQSVKFDGILNAGYDLSYTYANNYQQIANIADASYRAERSSGMYATGSVASDSIDHKTHSYRYDANGNLLYVGTGKKINDSTLLESSTRRLLWDEDNRLLAISDNGYVSNYWYDASGERTVKQSGGSEGVFVNGVLSAARTQTSKFTAYVSPYLVVSNGGNYSKHIYVGSQRITSKLSNSLIFNESRNPLTITKANNSVEPINATDYQAKFNTLTGTIAERFDSLGVIYKGTVQSDGLITQGTSSGVTPQYFYHPDHLGSSSLITDENGLMVQHIQYVPFGEVFVEERTTSWSTPYKFNAKELDPETGLYYYHARYYDPRTSVWLSVDPLAEKYPNVSSYVYCNNNPIIYIDPDGREWEYSRNSNGKTHISVGVNFNVSKDVNITAEQISSYQSAINTQFNTVLQSSSNGNFSGSITFDGGNNSQQFTPSSTMTQSQSNIAGLEGNGSFAANLMKSDGTIKTPEEYALDYIHELLHTVRLAHPFEITQSEDTKLVHNGGSNYLSTPSTDPNILFNIMSYPMITVNGESTTSQNQTSLTSGQLNFVHREIDSQTQGYGNFIYNNNLTNGQNAENYSRFYTTYWNTIPGVPVQNQ